MKTARNDAALLEALESYAAHDPSEIEAVQRIHATVLNGEPWARSSELHVTCSAIVIDPASARVLLRWHARMEAWMQVGGHADPGEADPWQIALREAREETGLDDLEAWPPGAQRKPVQVVIVPVPAHRNEPAHEHADIRYVFRTSRPERAAAESRDTPLRWLALPEAFEAVQEENLREFLRRIRSLLQD